MALCQRHKHVTNARCYSLRTFFQNSSPRMFSPVHKAPLYQSRHIQALLFSSRKGPFHFAYRPASSQNSSSAGCVKHRQKQLCFGGIFLSLHFGLKYIELCTVEKLGNKTAGLAGEASWGSRSQTLLCPWPLAETEPPSGCLLKPTGLSRLSRLPRMRK